MSHQESETLPPYSYVPGGPWPHPRSSPEGHSYQRSEPHAPPIVPDQWQDSAVYLRGITLFNAGYYWEAHEAWELLWHAHGRKGPVADVLKALIKLAAAGVKAREGQSHGVRVHAGRAQGLFQAVRMSVGRTLLGLDLEEYERIASKIASGPPPVDQCAEATRSFRFGFRIDPSRVGEPREQGSGATCKVKAAAHPAATGNAMSARQTEDTMPWPPPFVNP